MLGTFIRRKRSPFEVVALDWSPDGRYLASGGAQQVDIWLVNTGRKVHTLRPDTTISTVTWSPDGTQIAIGSATDRQVTIWDVASGKRLLTYSGHTTLLTRPTSTTRIWSIVWLPDGKLMASKARELHVWDRATGETRWAAPNHTEAFACSPDGRLIITLETEWTWKRDPEQEADVLDTATERRVMRDAQTGEEMRELSPDHSPRRYIPGAPVVVPQAWMPDGRHVVQCTRSALSVYDSVAKSSAHTWESHHSNARLALSPDGNMVATAGRLLKNSNIFNVSLWETRSGRLMAALQWDWPTSEARALAWSPDSKRIAVSGPGTYTRIWELTESPLPFAL